MDNEQRPNSRHLLRGLAREAVVFALLGLFFVLAADFALDSKHSNPLPEVQERSTDIPKQENPFAAFGGYRYQVPVSISYAPKFDGDTQVPGYTLFQAKDGEKFYLKGENLSEDAIKQRVAHLRAPAGGGDRPATMPERSDFVPNAPPVKVASANSGASSGNNKYELSDLGGKPVTEGAPNSNSSDLPNVSGMIADPMFQKLSPRDKRKALAGLTHDKGFLSLSDEDTMKFISESEEAQNKIVIAPNGEVGNIPAGRLPDALAVGYRTGDVFDAALAEDDFIVPRKAVSQRNRRENTLAWIRAFAFHFSIGALLGLPSGLVVWGFYRLIRFAILG